MKPTEDDDLPDRLPQIPTEFDSEIAALGDQIRKATKDLDKLVNARLKTLSKLGRACVRAYIRKSSRSELKQINSIKVQASIIAEHVVRKELCDPKAIQWYRDSESATSYDLSMRDGGKALLSDLAPGDHVVVLRWDRMFRTVEDGLRTLKIWKQKGVTFHLVDFDGLSLDSSNPTHEFILTIIAAAARLECALKGQRVRDTAAYLKAMDPNRSLGSTPPIGWKVVTRPLKKGLRGAASPSIAGSTGEKMRFGKFWAPDHEERAMVLWFRDELMGRRKMSYRQIAMLCWSASQNPKIGKQGGPGRWTRSDGKPWSKSSVFNAINLIAVDFAHHGVVAANIAEEDSPQRSEEHLRSEGQSSPHTNESHPTSPSDA